MSLIHDALKKAGGKNRYSSLPEEPAVKASAAGRKKVPRIGRSKTAALIIPAVLLVMIWSSYIFFSAHFAGIDRAVDRPANNTRKEPALPEKSELPKVVKLPSVDELNSRAFASFAKGDYAESVSLFSESLRIDINQPIVRNNLGLALKKSGDLKAAENHYWYLVKKNSADSQTYNNLAVLLEETGREKEALRQYRKALDLNPDYPEAHLNLALFLEKKGDMAEALIHYRLFLDSAIDSHYDLVKEVSAHLKEIVLP